MNSEELLASEARFALPDEAAPHECTWMAFGASAAIWGRSLLTGVQDNLAAIARTIAQYESVKLLVRDAEYELAAAKCGTAVELIVCSLNDLWVRDSGPIFVQETQGQKAALDFNFNGWGNKQAHRRDAEVARFIAQQAAVPRVVTDLVLEGGSIEVDGQGTALMTESSVLNANRNPGLSKADCEAILQPLLGLQKIIWLPGIAGRDITDGHIDFYARFARPGTVVAALELDSTSFDYEVTRRHLEILQAATDADGCPLEVIEIPGPETVRPEFDSADFAAGYINFYVFNGAVLLPEFGDRAADRRAQNTLTALFPDRDIITLNIDAIAAGGGGIHCTTQQEPALD
ncbi:MAG: agmatine deiminase family protein [Spirulinaceae cyanobacterium SM2_1_0]|nr:agmatine deiminase family protein [Spirulinaceae cyanobacterium SM2_1_0]